MAKYAKSEAKVNGMRRCSKVTMIINAATTAM